MQDVGFDVFCIIRSHIKSIVYVGRLLATCKRLWSFRLKDQIKDEIQTYTVAIKNSAWSIICARMIKNDEASALCFAKILKEYMTNSAWETLMEKATQFNMKKIVRYIEDNCIVEVLQDWQYIEIAKLRGFILKHDNVMARRQKLKTVRSYTHTQMKSILMACAESGNLDMIGEFSKMALNEIGFADALNSTITWSIQRRFTDAAIRLSLLLNNYSWLDSRDIFIKHINESIKSSNEGFFFTTANEMLMRASNDEKKTMLETACFEGIPSIVSFLIDHCTHLGTHLQVFVLSGYENIYEHANRCTYEEKYVEILKIINEKVKVKLGHEIVMAGIITRCCHRDKILQLELLQRANVITSEIIALAEKKFDEGVVLDSGNIWHQPHTVVENARNIMYKVFGNPHKRLKKK